MSPVEDFANLLVGGLTLPPELIFVARCIAIMIAVDVMCCLVGVLAGAKRASS